MSLMLIDGVLCCPKTEFNHLISIRGLKSFALTDGRKYISEREAKELQGAKGRSYSGPGWGAFRSIWGSEPDDWVIREIYKAIQPAYDGTRAQVGEETIDGEIWPGADSGSGTGWFNEYWTDADGKRHYNTSADLSVIGPASLGGKIILELCKRLAAEVYKDDEAQGLYSRRYRPEEDHIQQPTEAVDEYF